MERNEMEMTQEEFQSWISETLQKKDATPLDILKQRNLFKSAMEKRGEQGDRLQEFENYMAAYEVSVKDRFAFLGWQYADADSDQDAIEITSDDGISPSSPWDPEKVDAIWKEAEKSTKPTENSTETNPGISPVDNANPNGSQPSHSNTVMIPFWGSSSSQSCTSTPNDNFKGSKDKDQLRMSLTRLPESKIQSSCQRTPEKRNRVSEHLSPVASDDDFGAGPSTSKKRRIAMKCLEKTRAKEETRPPVDPIRKKAKKSTRTTKSIEKNNTKPTKNNTKSKTNPVDDTNPTGSQPSQSGPVGNQACKITRCCVSPEGDSKVPVEMPAAKIKVGMEVLAKKMSMCWQRAKVKKWTITANDKLKYSVRFHDKTKRLVSAHHLAFVATTKLEYLYIGARVVVGRNDDHDDDDVFWAGIVAELPTRKNHQRFLVFLDDQSALYVGLPHLHLVIAPLGNPVDDIGNTSHRKFVKGYIKAWPYPPLTQCILGQSLKVEHKGVQQSCVVRLLDCSLMQVQYEESQCLEWIYKGSWRFEEMVKRKQIR
ncbi:histone-lysine N-methyltransferase SETDB1-A [Festucalex cinctus]